MAKPWLQRFDEATRKAHLQQRNALASAFPEGSRVEFQWNHRQRNLSTGVVVAHEHGYTGRVRIRNDHKDRRGRHKVHSVDWFNVRARKDGAP